MSVNACLIYGEANCSESRDLFLLQPLLSKVCYCAVLPALVVMGISGNLLVSTIYYFDIRQGRDKHVVQYCLIGKMFWDCFALASAPCVFTFPLILPDGFYPGLWFSYGVVHTCRTAGVWMAAAIAVERFLAVWMPFQHQRFYTKHRVKMLILVISVSSLFYCAPKFMEFAPVKCSCQWRIFPRSYRVSKTYQMLYILVFHCLFLFLLPFGTVLVLNILIYWSIRKSTRHLKYAVCGSKALSRKDQSTTLMLVVEALVFVACNTVTVILNLVESCAPGQFSNSQLLSHYLPNIGNVLTFASCANNFPIFYIFGSTFRAKVKSLFRGEKGMSIGNFVDF